MNINRDNYEEYFLLYADNELTDSEKAEVLMFIKENRDLDEEFRMIHHAISKPDLNVELGDKSFLFKNDASAFISEKNYEEIFVLYHDNELTQEQRLETKQFLSFHSKLKEEFDLIGMARLTAEDAVVFSNKKLLYKKEETGKLVPLIFWKALAAAVLIGFGLWISYPYLKTPEKVVGITKQPAGQKPAVPRINKNIDKVKTTENVVAQNPSSDKSSINNAPTKDKQPQKPINHKEDNHNSVAKIHDNIRGNAEKIILKPVPQKINNEIAIADDSSNHISKEEIAANNNIVPVKELRSNVGQKIGNDITPPNYAQTASYVQDANSKNDNYVFYNVSTDEFKKTKVGGFLKKVKRLVERNNPIGRLIAGDERQVVSN